MSITAVNASYFNGMPSGNAGAQGQIASQGGLTGPQAKGLLGVGTFVLDGSTTTGLTLNFIDGTQKPFQNLVYISASGVTTAATINGVANQSVISGVGSFGALRVGQSITTSGYSNSGNNGTFTVNVVTTSSITVTNSSAVAETNPAGLVAYNQGTYVLGAVAARAIRSIAGVSDTAATTIYTTVTGVSDTALTLTISGTGSNTQTLSVLFELFPVS